VVAIVSVVLTAKDRYLRLPQEGRDMVESIEIHNQMIDLRQQTCHDVGKLRRPARNAGQTANYGVIVGSSLPDLNPWNLYQVDSHDRSAGQHGDLAARTILTDRDAGYALPAGQVPQPDSPTVFEQAHLGDCSGRSLDPEQAATWNSFFENGVHRPSIHWAPVMPTDPRRNFSRSPTGYPSGIPRRRTTVFRVRR